MTPYFNNLSDFIAMGGHGSFVWLCYAIVFISIFGLIFHAKRERQATLAKLARQHGAGNHSGRLTNKQRKSR